MKRFIIAGSIAALAFVGTAGTANAASADAACFGQIHKAVNAGDVPPFGNVGDLVKAVGGQGKKEIAGACRG